MERHFAERERVRKTMLGVDAQKRVKEPPQGKKGGEKAREISPAIVRAGGNIRREYHTLTDTTGSEEIVAFAREQSDALAEKVRMIQSLKIGPAAVKYDPRA